MEGLLPLLIIIISFALSASNRRKRQAASQRAPAKAIPAKAAVNKAPKNAGIPKTMPEPLKAREEEPDEDSDRDGSIDMPPMEPHEHEGKPMPCPAEERELPRPRPAAQTAVTAPARPAALQLNFRRNSVVQGVVMAEVLTRPKFQNGRRVIR
ncbi:MAG: hypothetical protein IJU12_03615 [Clostridia bacterium]|nr:hypothetical protein [Clostridia bacterium]